MKFGIWNSVYTPILFGCLLRYNFPLCTFREKISRNSCSETVIRQMSSKFRKYVWQHFQLSFYNINQICLYFHQPLAVMINYYFYVLDLQQQGTQIMECIHKYVYNLFLHVSIHICSLCHDLDVNNLHTFNYFSLQKMHQEEVYLPLIIVKFVHLLISVEYLSRQCYEIFII